MISIGWPVVVGRCAKLSIQKEGKQEDSFKLRDDEGKKELRQVNTNKEGRIQKLLYAQLGGSSTPFSATGGGKKRGEAYS